MLPGSDLTTEPAELSLIRGLLFQLLGPEGRRRLTLRNKPNQELLKLYDNELVLRLHNVKNLRDTRVLLSHFFEFLGDNSPSTDAAKAFLAQYANHKPPTRYRYTQMIKFFMKLVW
jgi:hypothetical protein